MQDISGAIEKMMREHSDGLEAMEGCKTAADRLASLETEWVPGKPVVVADEVRQLQERLTTIHRNMSEHMRFEEEEFLPTLTKYATQILAYGLCFEHAAILDSITELREKVPDFVGEPANREELLAGQARVREQLDNIRQLLQEHCHKGGMIAELAREAIESQAG